MKESLKRLKRRALSLTFGLCMIFAVALIWTNRHIAVDKVQADAALLVELPVIMYHSGTKNPLQAGEWTVTADMFDADLHYLQEHGYTTVTSKEVLAYVEGTGELPEKPIMITFDDGYYNNMIHAKPVLERYHMRAIVSPIGYKTDEYSNSDDKNPSYAYLSWEDLYKLQESGTFEIGNHSYNLHRQDAGRIGVARKQWENEREHMQVLMDDIGKLQAEIQAHCGVTPVAFAYPFGKYDEESERILHDMGFKLFFTCYEKTNYIERDASQPLRLGRFNRVANESTEAFMQRALKH